MRFSFSGSLPDARGQRDVRGEENRRCPGVALPSQMSRWALVSPTWELSAVGQALCAHPGGDTSLGAAVQGLTT